MHTGIFASVAHRLAIDNDRFVLIDVVVAAVVAAVVDFPAVTVTSISLFYFKQNFNQKPLQ